VRRTKKGKGSHVWVKGYSYVNKDGKTVKVKGHFKSR
jgi:hypothetical protein